MSKLISLGRAFILGVVNGLLVGSVAYTLLWLSADPYEHGSLPILWWGLPAVGGAAAGVASALVHSLLARQVKSVVALWQLVGVATVIFGYAHFMLIFLAGEYSYFHLSDWVSAGAGVIVLRFLAVVVPFNLLYAFFIRLAAAQYQGGGGVELP